MYVPIVRMIMIIEIVRIDIAIDIEKWSVYLSKRIENKIILNFPDDSCKIQMNVYMVMTNIKWL
jgi:hypothetical protein